MHMCGEQAAARRPLRLDSSRVCPTPYKPASSRQQVVAGGSAPNSPHHNQQSHTSSLLFPQPASSPTSQVMPLGHLSASCSA